MKYLPLSRQNTARLLASSACAALLVIGIPTAASTHTLTPAPSTAPVAAAKPNLNAAKVSAPKQTRTRQASARQARGFRSATATQQQYDAVLARYIVTSEDGMPRFDEARARKERASADVLELGAVFNEVAAEQAPSLSNALEDPRSLATQGVSPYGTSMAAISLPIYGNWCGPGYGGGTPIDTLDRACMRHDNCYGIEGYFSCSCDYQLIADINFGWPQMRIKEKIYATAVKAYFTVQTKVMSC